MHQITDFLQFTCIISTFYESPLKSLLVCKVLTYTISTFYDNHVRSFLVCKVFFEMTAGIQLKYAKNMKFTMKYTHTINRIIMIVKQQSHAIAIVLEITQPYY